MSSLAWIDFDDAERERAQRILSFFEEKDTRDELGLGSIRDAIADRLFPGTSTIQTRLRYMLFVPWLFQKLEGERGSTKQLADQARRLETRFIEALKSGGEVEGVIGARVGVGLKRLPSSIYWAGLLAWGVRTFEGSIESYFAYVGGGRRRVDTDGDEAPPSRRSPFWAATLPPPPNDLLEQATFSLNVDEAEFLKDRLAVNQPLALLTLLARERDDADCAFIWEHPSLSTFPSEIREIVQHSERFSGLMQGAALLYNLMLAERVADQELIENYRGDIDDWRSAFDAKACGTWPLDRFWDLLHQPGREIRPATRRFVTEWRDLTLANVSAFEDEPSARRLIETRERQLKKKQSRFENRSVLDRWRGASGVGRMDYRWRQTQSHLKDLADAR